MQKPNLIILFISSFFFFFLFSCVDHKYDFDDDNLDKDAVFSPDGGIHFKFYL